MDNLYLVLAVVIAYLLGNISPSTILAKMAGKDIKKEGSGNAGTTNALRVLGKKAALITLVIDIGKGVVAVLLGGIISGRLQVPRGTPEKKVYFDSFGLPIFDLSVARTAWLRAKKLGLGTPIPW